MSSFDLWFSRIQRLKRRPSKEVVTFCFKEIIKTPNFILASKDNVINLNQVILGYTNEEKVLNELKKRCINTFYFNPLDTNLSELYKKRFPKSYNKILKVAEEYVNGDFKFLGKKIQFENWHSIEGVRWPAKVPPRKINYFGSDRKGDIKYIWELNRMQFLPLLGIAYFLTDNEKYARSVLSYIESWIDQNPYFKGTNWMEGIEAAIRMYSWIFAYHFILGSNSLKPALNNKILKSIYQHAKFIRNFNSDKWIINNNHFIAELSGLILIGLSFPQFKESGYWVNFAIQKLKKEVDRQVFDDGFLWEHSLGYHKFVTELLSFAVILLKKNGYHVPKSVSDKLEGMFECLNFISMKNCIIPMIGDEDQGIVIKLGFEEYDEISDILGIGNVLFERGDFRQKNDSELVFWLFNGKKKSNRYTSSIESSFKVYEDSGYGLFKTKNGYLLFITSAQKEKYLHAGHRHLDMLSIVYEQNGEYFIVDPGTYTYFADDAMRNKFRGISMHNTITIDGKNPADLSGLFELYPRPEAKLVDYRTYDKTINYIWASHTGYKPLIHNRVIIQFPEGFVIYDFVKGDSKIHKFESFLHLHPEVKILRKNDKNVVLKNNNEIVFIFSDKKIIKERSFFSPKYGTIMESKALKIETQDECYENYIYILSNEKSMEKMDSDSSDFINKTLKFKEINSIIL